MVVAKFGERIQISKQEAEIFDKERFNPRTLNKLEVRKEYQIETSNRSAALENINDGEDISKAWENIKNNI